MTLNSSKNDQRSENTNLTEIKINSVNYVNLTGQKEKQIISKIFDSLIGQKIHHQKISEIISSKFDEIKYLDNILDIKANVNLIKSEKIEDQKIPNLKDNFSKTDSIPADLVLEFINEPKFYIKMNYEIDAVGDIHTGSEISLSNNLEKGEKFKLSFDKSLDGMSQYEFSTELRGQPNEGKNKPKISVFKKVNDMTNFVSLKEYSKGIQFTLFKSIFGNTIKYNYIKRENVNAISNYGSKNFSEESILQSLFPTTKSSISIENVILNSIDNIASPKKGNYLSYFSEFSGLKGDVNFLKMELNYSKFFPIPKLPFFTFGFKTKLGFLYNFESIKTPFLMRESNINDRFFLGGINTIRGYDNNSVGPNSSLEKIGGDIMFNNSLTLKFPIPISFCLDNGITGHLFLNLGGVSKVHCAESPGAISQNLRKGALDCWRGIKMTFGVGFDLPLRQIGGSLRFSFGKPFNKAKGDRLAAFQIGLCSGVK